MDTQGKRGLLVAAQGLHDKVIAERAAETRRSQRRFLALAEVESIVRLKKSSIYRMMAEGLFPNVVRVSPRCVAWLSTDIDAWMQARIDGDTTASGSDGASQ